MKIKILKDYQIRPDRKILKGSNMEVSERVAMQLSKSGICKYNPTGKNLIAEAEDKGRQAIEEKPQEVRHIIEPLEDVNNDNK